MLHIMVYVNIQVTLLNQYVEHTLCALDIKRRSVGPLGICICICICIIYIYIYIYIYVLFTCVLPCSFWSVASILPAEAVSTVHGSSNIANINEQERRQQRPVAASPQTKGGQPPEGGSGYSDWRSIAGVAPPHQDCCRGARGEVYVWQPCLEVNNRERPSAFLLRQRRRRGSTP